MIITYTPAGQPPQTWTYRHMEVAASVAETVEDTTGMTWSEIEWQVIQGRARARRAILWLLLRREHPALKWEDCPDFAMGELDVQLEDDDLERYIAITEQLPDTPDLQSARETLRGMMKAPKRTKVASENKGGNTV